MRYGLCISCVSWTAIGRHLIFVLCRENKYHLAVQCWGLHSSDNSRHGKTSTKSEGREVAQHGPLLKVRPVSVCLHCETQWGGISFYQQDRSEERWSQPSVGGITARPRGYQPTQPSGQDQIRGTLHLSAMFLHSTVQNHVFHCWWITLICLKQAGGILKDLGLNINNLCNKRGERCMTQAILEATRTKWNNEWDDVSVIF